MATTGTLEMPASSMSNEDATQWLGQLINKNLRIHTSDNRVFVGQMRCTDKVARTYPYSKLQIQNVRRSVIALAAGV
jgi:N-alpha-acetyltransferase 38, NatC auxiliary subunit